MLRSAASLLGILLICAPLASASDDWQPLTPEDLNLTSEQAGGAEAIILYHERNFDDNKGRRTEYMRIKILTEKGKRYADVEIPYHSIGGFGTHIADLKARMISPDGKITPFSGKVFDKTVIKGHGLSVKEKTFTFPDIQVGSIVEWRYTEHSDGFYLRPARWILQEQLPQKRAKFSYLPVPSGILSGYSIGIGHGNTADGVYYIEIGLPSGVAVNSSTGKNELEITNVPAYEEEEFSPPAEMMKMRVYFYYGNRKMLKPEEFWKEQGDFWDKDVERFMGHSSEVAEAAGQAVSGADTPEKKLRKIYAAVQGLTNLSYEPPELLQELIVKGKPNTSAEQVLSQRKGTHNDLTRLFVAMARAQNFPAYVMRVATREDTFFQFNVPDWDQLDSEVAIVNLPDGKQIFLDPGTRFCPYGLLQWKRTLVDGLRQKVFGGTQLSRTPAPTYLEAMTQRIADLTLERDGTLKGKIALLWMGQEGLERRLEGSLTDEAGRKKAMEDELKALLPSSSVVKLDTLTGSDEPDQPLKAWFTVELPGFAASTGKRLLLPAELFSASKRQIFVHSERKTPIYFEYPYRIIDRVQITLPVGVQVENLPQSQPATAEFAQCSVQRTVKENVLEFRRDFAINGISFPVAEYPKLKSFFDKVHANDEEQVTLRTTPVAASN